MNELGQRIADLAGRKTIAADALGALATAILARCGVAEADARSVAEALVDAQLRGSQAHGVMHLPAYARGLLEGTINPAPRLQFTAGRDATAVIDADNGLGILAANFAIDRLAPIARRHGIAAAAVRNSNHFGTGSYFVERAASQGLICLGFSNASPTMAPFGARQPVLGTNPIAAGFPLPGADPIALDMSTSAVARARIRQAEREGTAIPADWSLDAEGRPTTDPVAALKGTILPMAGAKGYGLALMAELLSSTLSDGRPGFAVASPHESVGAPAGVSHCFIVIDPDGFCGAERQGARAKAIADRISGLPGIDPASPPRLPGERGHAARRRALKEGIALTPSLSGALAAAVKLLDERATMRASKGVKA